MSLAAPLFRSTAAIFARACSLLIASTALAAPLKVDINKLRQQRDEL